MLDKPERVKLTAPHRDGNVALERCIVLRRSVREFCNRPLTLTQLSQLLWAAQGVTAPDGARAAPSAGGLYPLELYVVAVSVASLAAGVYRYHPHAHELVLIARAPADGQLARATYDQQWIPTAPVIVCIAACFERTTAKYGDRGRGYVYLEAGHAAENLMLQAVALDLAATTVGAFSDGDIKRILHLDASETPLCLLPIGAP